MERSNLIFPFFALLILLLGCTNPPFIEKTQNNTIAVFKSRGILHTDLYVNALGKHILVGENIKYPIFFKANITNSGDSDATGIICIEGLSNWDTFSYNLVTGEIIPYNGPLCKKFEIEKRMKEADYSSYIEVYIPGVNIYASPPTVPGKTKQEINVEICYNYTTEVHYMLCFNKPSGKIGECNSYIIDTTKSPIKISKIQNPPLAGLSIVDSKIYYVIPIRIYMKNIEPDSIVVNESIIDVNINKEPAVCTFDNSDLSSILYKINFSIYPITLEDQSGYMFICSNLSIDDYYAQRFSIICTLYLDKNIIERYYPDASQVEIPIDIKLTYGILKRKTYYLDLTPIK